MIIKLSNTFAVVLERTLMSTPGDLIVKKKKSIACEACGSERTKKHEKIFHDLHSTGVT
jgi:hypothetical protein